MKSQIIYDNIENPRSPYKPVRETGDYRKVEYLPKKRSRGDYRPETVPIRALRAPKGTAHKKAQKGMSSKAKKVLATIAISYLAIAGGLTFANHPNEISSVDTTKTEYQQIDERDYLNKHPEIIQTKEDMETLIALSNKKALDLSAAEHSQLVSLRNNMTLDKVIQYSDYITRSQIAKAVNPKLGSIDIEDIKLGPDNISIEQGDKITTIEKADQDYQFSKLLKNSFYSDPNPDFETLKRIYTEAKEYDDSGSKDVIAFSRLANGGKIELASANRINSKQTDTIEQNSNELEK